MLLTALAGVVALVGSCSTAGPGNTGLPLPSNLRVEVLETRPHDRTAFTQGLELVDGKLYESTGGEGSSGVRITNPETAQVIRRVNLSTEYFGEGIAVVGNRLWQLTWQQGVAFLRDRDTLAELDRVSYQGEGWGLCYDGTRLVMSNGSNVLTFRDPQTFAQLGTLTVHSAHGPVSALNELECAQGQVWANVWETEQILRINPVNGMVTAVVDASGLLSTHDRSGTDVLNGIAAIRGTDEFLLTGKLWPTLFRVRFIQI